MLGNEIPFSIDYRSAGVWANCKQSWLLYDPTAEYHVVIQDDAIVCENFLVRAEEVIEQAEKKHEELKNRPLNGDKIGPLFAINFYYGSRAKLQDEADRGLKEGFLVRHTPSWGVAICLRTEWIREMIEYCDRMNIPQDDARIAAYLKHKNIMSYFPIPSLIDHRTGKETPSLVGDPGDYRQAFYFIDRPRKK